MTLDAAAHLWHPWSAFGATVPTMVAGSGCRVVDRSGKSYIDAISGALNVSCGYGQTSIVDAATRQMLRLPHFDGMTATHAPAAELAARLADLLPGTLSRVLFANSGSEANEAAVRMVMDYWRNVGTPRERFITLQVGYHGSTMITQYLSGLSFVSQPSIAPFPVARVTLPSAASQLRALGAADLLLAEFEKSMDAGEGPAAAVVIEPLPNVGGGVVLPPGFLRGLRELCDSRGTLLVVDEIFTGFGRTGRMFAVDHEDITPDVMTVSKGISSGYVPLSAVAATERIYASYDGAEIPVLRYGHTTSGHAVACAVALAVLDVIHEHKLVENADQRGNQLLSGLLGLTSTQGVSDVRGLGLCTVVQMDSPDRAAAVKARAKDLGALLRVQDCSVMAIPPLIVDAADVDELVAIMSAAVSGTGEQ